VQRRRPRGCTLQGRGPRELLASRFAGLGETALCSALTGLRVVPTIYSNQALVRSPWGMQLCGEAKGNNSVCGDYLPCRPASATASAASNPVIWAPAIAHTWTLPKAARANRCRRAPAPASSNSALHSSHMAGEGDGEPGFAELLLSEVASAPDLASLPSVQASSQGTGPCCNGPRTQRYVHFQLHGGGALAVKA
jgi:hypothetical protein